MVYTKAAEDAIRAACDKSGAPELNILEVYVRSMPVEKGFALRQDMYGLTPYECGLDWSVNLDKDFIGKEALVKAKEEGPKYKLVDLEYLAESYEDKEAIIGETVTVGSNDSPAVITEKCWL